MRWDRKDNRSVLREGSRGGRSPGRHWTGSCQLRKLPSATLPVVDIQQLQISIQLSDEMNTLSWGWSWIASFYGTNTCPYFGNFSRCRVNLTWYDNLQKYYLPLIEVNWKRQVEDAIVPSASLSIVRLVMDSPYHTGMNGQRCFSGSFLILQQFFKRKGKVR